MMSPYVLKTLSTDTKSSPVDIMNMRDLCQQLTPTMELHFLWILHFHHSPLAQQVAEITFDVEETACGPSVTTPPRKKKNGER
ncbi:hypothetical protein NC653_023433 [Populus alba x Populus x berolinensis]|uniref:Uncharacterized protein n=1 Tax=Populus alba x Populus x berolinensis TaxID=444605 RepID=A0AAD6MH77_9ROSI|nr:hypothetical protein NC653_023433 [Populus alba x Populus x berolinensis]